MIGVLLAIVTVFTIGSIIIVYCGDNDTSEIGLHHGHKGEREW